VDATDAVTETSADAGTEAAAENVTGATTEAATWADRLWHRDNPRGLVRERWWHAHGCRLWLTVERDTTTNVIHSARGEPA
jgi:heterotetrameric sarcosine oxidase delta subunit